MLGGSASSRSWPGSELPPGVEGRGESVGAEGASGQRPAWGPLLSAVLPAAPASLSRGPAVLGALLNASQARAHGILRQPWMDGRMVPSTEGKGRRRAWEGGLDPDAGALASLPLRLPGCTPDLQVRVRGQTWALGKVGRGQGDTSTLFRGRLSSWMPRPSGRGHRSGAGGAARWEGLGFPTSGGASC